MSLTKHIQNVIGKRQVLRGHNPVCRNVKYLFSDFELDVISLSNSGMLYEFEVKISRSDFLADSKKKKFRLYAEDPMKYSNYFSYVCPGGLISPNEIREEYGLYYVIEDEITEIKKPKVIHMTRHHRLNILEKACRVMAEREFLGACRLTIKNQNLRKQATEHNLST